MVPVTTRVEGPIAADECGCCFRHHGGVRTLKLERAWVCDHCTRMDKLDLYPHSAPGENC